uniref:Uncharacterized protein n=1 Tax=Cucumis melo TaxID=3656 RepID=A0A9I9EL49_CUCME
MGEKKTTLRKIEDYQEIYLYKILVRGNQGQGRFLAMGGSFEKKRMKNEWSCTNLIYYSGEATKFCNNPWE